MTEFTGISVEEVKNQLKQLTIHHETETSTMILRIADPETAMKLQVLLEQWDTEASSPDAKVEEES